MRILDKYILKQMLQPFVFGVAAFSTIFVASSFLFRVTQYITQYGASYSSLFRSVPVPHAGSHQLHFPHEYAARLAFNHGTAVWKQRNYGYAQWGNELPPYCHANPCRWIRRQPFSVVWAEKLCRRRKPSMNASSSRKSRTTRNPVPRTISC
mgnify:CR=1 FL=1